jgi:hypothetical protein
MTAAVTGAAGFLLAVLWFDLMFDVQALRHAAGELPESVLTSTSNYYARVTTAARPMNRLIAAVMVATLAAIVVEIAGDDLRPWVAWASLALAGAAIVLAGARTVPNAVRLGAGTGATAERTRLARSIYRDHLLCLTAIASVLVLQLGFA